jgi:tetratricopeptide (TPR) repeat protein
LALLLLSAAPAPREAPLPCAAQAPSASAGKDYERCRARLSLDACNDAIRRNPSDPVLLAARGDALVRAGRPADALRAYQRAAALAPNTRVDAKIRATEAKLSAMRATRKSAAKDAGAQKNAIKRYSNAAAETQSH